MLTDSIIFEYGEVLCRDDGAKQLIWDMTHIFSVKPCRLDGAKQLFWDMKRPPWYLEWTSSELLGTWNDRYRPTSAKFPRVGALKKNAFKEYKDLYNDKC